MACREYKISISVNGSKIRKVIIDTHYEEKHRDSINDDLILRLVKTLDGELHEPVTSKVPFKYFVKEEILIDHKYYRLVWLLEDHEIYIGVINAYRRK